MLHAIPRSALALGLALTLPLAACGGGNATGPAAAAGTAPTTPPLGPTVSRAQVDRMLADGQLRVVSPERLEDGPASTGAPRATLEGDVVAVLVCTTHGRPAPPPPQFYVDAAGRFYVALAPVPDIPSPPPGAGGPMYTTECVTQRSRVPAGTQYAGELRVE